MGKLIRMWVPKRRLLWPKRLHWSRLLFLLGMLLTGSTYQHLKSPWGLPPLWEAVFSQHPEKLAIQNLSSVEMIMVSSDPPKTSFKLEGEVLVPQAMMSREETPTGIIMENTRHSPRRAANTTPTILQKNYSPTVTGTERVKEHTSTTDSTVLNRYILTSNRQTVKGYIPITSRGEMKSYKPTQVKKKVKKYIPSPPDTTVDNYPSFIPVTLKESHVTTPRTTVKDSETMATYKTVGIHTLKRTVEENISVTLKGIDVNTPVFLTNEVEINILTSPRSRVEKNSLTTPRRVGNNSSTKLWGLVGKNTLTVPQRIVLQPTVTSEGQVTIHTRSASSPAEIKSSIASWSIRNPSPRTNIPSSGIASTTFRGQVKRSSSAPSTSVTPRVRVNPTTQIRPCMTVEPELAVSTTPSPFSTTEEFSLSPSVLPPSEPDLHPKAEYPPDLFSVQERRQGWVVLHVFGIMYVFVALAIVCDEYFVPALGIITEKLQISEDVAGATFMAAGGSAPELFTSLIGVFISHSNVGIGTIVGSAVFNILFVIGTCALFSREILNLTWWPLFRDVSFYIVDLMMLILFFLDSLISWWESLLLLLAYALYVFTMKWNKQIELWVKEQLNRRPMVKVMALGDHSQPGDGAIAVDVPQDNKNLKKAADLDSYRETLPPVWVKEVEQCWFPGTSVLRRPALTGHKDTSRDHIHQEEPTEPLVVLVTPTPAPDVMGDPEEDADSQAGTQPVQMEPEGDMAEGKNTGKMTGGEVEALGEGETGAQSGGETLRAGEVEVERRGEVECEREGEIQSGGEGGKMKSDEGDTESHKSSDGNQSDENSADVEEGGDGDESEAEDEEEEEEEEEENEKPLSLEWPETRQKQAIFLFLLPIVLPLWLTMPDVRRLESRKFFVFTFLGSIAWIAVFSYLMVWWAHQIGETIGISEEIMGLTILAAGTSIPDLISSVIVARKGLGDMAVSSSVGSNIFDITVGLPVPWLLFSLINGLLPVPVSSNGLFCAIVLLFLMLLFVISSIATCKWRMNKVLGFTMFLLYFIFLIMSVMLENRMISCPVSV